MVRHYSPLIRARGKTLRRFTSKVGFVYFGTVDQRVDEHDVIRGLTVSTTHRDTHYAVGSYDDYDISMVDRFDVSYDAARKPVEHSWVIIQVTLQYATLPHVFFKPWGSNSSSYNKLFTAFNNLHVIDNVLYKQHSTEFHARYELYARIAQALPLEDTLTPEVTQAIATRFWPHAIEIYQGKLYVYITEHRLNETVLHSTLQSASWLAGVLDNNTE